jgi:hypothetical protein
MPSNADVLKALEALWDRAGSSGGEATIVSTYKSGYKWYRVWSDGFIEQGTRISVSGNATTTVTWPKTFSSTNYSVNGYILSGGADKEWNNPGKVSSIETSNVKIYPGFSESATISIIAFGY